MPVWVRKAIFLWWGILVGLWLPPYAVLVDDQDLEVEHLRADLACRIARALAPVHDASTAAVATSIPRTVG